MCPKTVMNGEALERTQTHVRLRTYKPLSVAPYRWKEDYGGKLQLFFPANFFEEVFNNIKSETKDLVGGVISILHGVTVLLVWGQSVNDFVHLCCIFLVVRVHF